MNAETKIKLHEGAVLILEEIQELETEIQSKKESIENMQDRLSRTDIAVMQSEIQMAKRYIKRFERSYGKVLNELNK